MSLFPCIGDTKKVVESAKTALEDRGHTLLPFELINDVEWTKLYFDLRYADLGDNLRQVLYGEQISPSMHGVYKIINQPNWLRKILAKIYQLFPESLQRNRKVQELRAGLDAQTSKQLWKCMTERKKLIELILSQMDELELDLILCPAFPFPALKVKDHAKLMGTD